MSITFFLPEEIKFSFTGNSVSKRPEFFWLLQCLTVKLIRALDKFNRLERTDCIGGQSRRKLAIVYFFDKIFSVPKMFKKDKFHIKFNWSKLCQKIYRVPMGLHLIKLSHCCFFMHRLKEVRITSYSRINSTKGKNRSGAFI